MTDEKIKNQAVLTLYSLENDEEGVVRIKVEYDPEQFKEGDPLPATHGIMMDLLQEELLPMMTELTSTEVQGNNTVN